MYHQPARFRFLSAFLCALLAAMIAISPVPSASALEETLSDQWYAVELQGSRAGWSHTKVVQDKGAITTLTETRLNMARDGVTIRIHMASKFVETVGGDPVSMWSLMKYSDIPVETTYVFGEKEVQVTSVQAGNETKTTIPLPVGAWLTPNEAAEYTLKRLKAGADVITLSTMDPSQGPVVFQMTRKITNRDADVDLYGIKRKAIECDATMNIGPEIVSREYLDPNDGTTLRGTTKMGSLEFTLVACDRDTALTKAEAPEVMIDTLVSPDRPIRRPRDATTLTAELSVKEGEMPDLPNTGSQSITRVSDSKARVVIKTVPDNPAPATDLADDRYLASTTYLDHKSQEITRLMEQSLQGKTDLSNADKAEVIRAFVHRYVQNKNLDQGFATATEVAKTQSGDCSEHGVLVAAMLRGAGIPARVASGLLYVDQFAGQHNVFGYHMWAQALIDGSWVDYDATLPIRFDATHITVCTSALKEGGTMMTDMASLMPLLGQLQIRVINVEYR